MTATIEVLRQLRKVTLDGDLASMNARDLLVERGYADRYRNHNFLTHKGVEVADDLGLLNFILEPKPLFSSLEIGTEAGRVEY